MKSKLALGLLLFVAACGDEERPATAPPGSGATGSGGTSPSGGSSGSSSGGMAGDGDGGEPPAVPGAPIVMVTSPEALAHPNDGEVLVSDEVEVLCSVTKSPDAGSLPVNPSTVYIEALDGGGNVVGDAAGTPTSNDNEYSADLIISSVPNGIVSFKCSASDTSEIPLVGEHIVSTFVDHGPAINVRNPLPDSAHALQGVLRFEFTVDPAPLAAGDDGAALDEVELEVNGISVPVMSGADGLYAADVQLSEPMMFPTTPTEDVPVVIRATNVRTPIAAERLEIYSFTIDAEGPVITITSHQDESLLGGQDTLIFTVIDEFTDVDEESVVVQINQVDEYRYDPSDANWTLEDGGKFSLRIDSRNVSGTQAQVTINILASDTVGNSSKESRTLFLDNQPPIVDLDPGNVRAIKRDGSDRFCSESFDPLGDGITLSTGMPNDRTVVENAILPRALVWDLTNGTFGQNYHYFAGVDPTDVYLYLQVNPAVPMLVDTDDDMGNVCDDIDRTLDLPFIRLNPIDPKGASYYGAADNDDPVPNGSCEFQVAPDPERPPQLCAPVDSDMNRVISHTIAGQVERVIYGKGSITDIECTGGEWEPPVPPMFEGWICLVAVATDTKGNRGVSAPQRLCFDNGLVDGAPACASALGSAPDCFADCALPPRFAGGIYEFR